MYGFYTLFDKDFFNNFVSCVNSFEEEILGSLKDEEVSGESVIIDSDENGCLNTRHKHLKGKLGDILKDVYKECNAIGSQGKTSRDCTCESTQKEDICLSKKIDELTEKVEKLTREKNELKEANEKLTKKFDTLRKIFE